MGIEKKELRETYQVGQIQFQTGYGSPGGEFVEIQQGEETYRLPLANVLEFARQWNEHAEKSGRRFYPPIMGVQLIPRYGISNLNWYDFNESDQENK